MGPQTDVRSRLGRYLCVGSVQREGIHCYFFALRAIFPIGCMLRAAVTLCGVDTGTEAPILGKHVPFPRRRRLHPVRRSSPFGTPRLFPRAEVGSEDAFLMGRRVAIPPLAVVVSGSRGDQRGGHASSRSGRQGDVGVRGRTAHHDKRSSWVWGW